MLRLSRLLRSWPRRLKILLYSSKQQNVALIASNEALIMLLETFGVVDSDRFALTPRTGEGEENGTQPPTDGSLGGSPGGGPAGDQQSILQ